MTSKHLLVNPDTFLLFHAMHLKSSASTEALMGCLWMRFTGDLSPTLGQWPLAQAGHTPRAVNHLAVKAAAVGQSNQGEMQFLQTGVKVVFTVPDKFRLVLGRGLQKKKLNEPRFVNTDIRNKIQKAIRNALIFCVHSNPSGLMFKEKCGK